MKGSAATTKQYLNNRVGRYMNVARPGGNQTELGHFYFCRHPDFLAGGAKVAEAIFVVNVTTGLCALYNGIKSISATNRTSIRNHFYNGTLHNGAIKYIYQSEFVKLFPQAAGLDKLILNKQQLKLVKSNTPLLGFSPIIQKY